MDIVISKSLSESLPDFCTLLQATIQQEDAVELFRPIVEHDIVPDLKTIIFRHHSASIHPHARNLSTLLVPASEYLSLNVGLESAIRDLRNATAPSTAQIIIYGLAEHDASGSRLDEAERALIRVQMTQTAHYFFLEDIYALATSVYYSAAARNPFLCRFQQGPSGTTAEDIVDIHGRYLNVLLQISGFTIPEARAVARAFPSPRELWGALGQPNQPKPASIERKLWERLEPWRRFLIMELAALSPKRN